jgi:hypothetical protein
VLLLPETTPTLKRKQNTLTCAVSTTKKLQHTPNPQPHQANMRSCKEVKTKISPTTQQTPKNSLKTKQNPNLTQKKSKPTNPHPHKTKDEKEPKMINRTKQTTINSKAYSQLEKGYV